MKRIVSLLLVLALSIGACVLLSGCSAAPRVEDIYDRVVYLIEESYEINTILYGKGLPVIGRDSEYASIKHAYAELDQNHAHVNYEMIDLNHAKIVSIEEIKARAKKIYSTGYLDAKFEYCFKGYAVNNGSGQMVVESGRYFEDSFGFFLSTDPSPFRCEMRIYDYSTMKVQSLGRKDACAVTMDSWLESSPDKIEVVEIYLVLENGQWLLDSETSLG